MSDEFSKRERGMPSKDIRANQNHGAVMSEDTRWTQARRPRVTKPACTKERRAPAFQQAKYLHPDFTELPGRGPSIELQCRWCGHRWKEPR